MVKKGYRAITVREELAEQLGRDGLEHGRTIPEQIRHLAAARSPLKVSKKQREILRCELAQMAEDLRKKNPRASFPQIKQWLQEMLDVTI